MFFRACSRELNILTEPPTMSIDICTTVCIVAAIDDPCNAFNLPHNKAFLGNEAVASAKKRQKRQTREGTPSRDDSRSHFCLDLHNHPKVLHTGFVFGSDPESCDLLLDNPDKAAGVSGVHFRLQLDTERAEPDTILGGIHRAMEVGRTL